MYAWKRELLTFAALFAGGGRPRAAGGDVSRVPVVEFQAADSRTETAIGEGLTRLARAAGRLRVDTAVGKYAVAHGDGCGVCGAAVAAGDTFYLDSDAGEILCETHGRERRGEDG
jgi:hypothetical protein